MPSYLDEGSPARIAVSKTISISVNRIVQTYTLEDRVRGLETTPRPLDLRPIYYYSKVIVYYA
jgi:hypothetical protein